MHIKGVYGHDVIEGFIPSQGKKQSRMLDNNRKIKLENTPSITVSHAYIYCFTATTAEMLALTSIQQGDVCILINQNDQATKSYIVILYTALLVGLN